jgi:DeoR/GlpR family transcriptional regulator of sugar metabolism
VEWSCAPLPVKGTESLSKDDSQHRPILDLATRLALRPEEAARALGVSERTLRRMLPEIPHIRHHGIVMLPVDSLREWLKQTAQAGKSRTDEAVSEIMADFDD